MSGWVAGESGGGGVGGRERVPAVCPSFPATIGPFFRGDVVMMMTNIKVFYDTSHKKGKESLLSPALSSVVSFLLILRTHYQ